MERNEYGIQRRVRGHHDFRFDGVSDVLMRMHNASVFDVGCNRGMVCVECAANGASLVHGCDIYEPGIITAREIFADIRNCKHRFEVVDLNGGANAIRDKFGQDYGAYDFMLLLAVYHKLRRSMEAGPLQSLMSDLAGRTRQYIVWRGYDEEIAILDKLFSVHGFKRCQTSTICKTIGGSAAIWEK